MTLIRPDLNDRSVRNKVLGSSVPDLARERGVHVRVRVRVCEGGRGGQKNWSCLE